MLDSYGYSIVESRNRCAVAVNATGDLLGVDPGLLPLDFTGGPTPVRPLRPDRLAIDRGSCTDMSGAAVGANQRGVVRPQGVTCDIGAYESNASLVSTRYYCWDLDEDDACDPSTEDRNGDSDCTPTSALGPERRLPPRSRSTVSQLGYGPQSAWRRAASYRTPVTRRQPRP